MGAYARIEAGPAAAALAAPTEPTTLGALCTDLGSDVVEVAVAPRGLDVVVCDVGLHDALDAPTPLRSDVVLALGAAGDDAQTVELLRAAEAGGAAALVCKRRYPLTRAVVDIAEETGVALLTVDPVVAWGDLYGLVSAALEADRSSELPRGAGRFDDLFALADTIAALADGPVTIEDPEGRVLAFSRTGQEIDPPRVATILGRRVPEHWMEEMRRRGVYQQLNATEGSLLVEMPDGKVRRAVPIRAGRALLGSIWVAAEDGPADAHAEAALVEAARLAALQLMRTRVVGDIEARVRSGMLRQLLCEQCDPDPALERLGLTPGASYAVVAIEPQPSSCAPERLFERLADLVVLHLTAYRHKAAAIRIEERVYVLVGNERTTDRRALRERVQDCITRARAALQTDLRVGLGDAVTVEQGLSGARESADLCVDLADAPNEVAAFEEMHGRALLAHVRSYLGGRRFPLAHELEALIEYDRANASDYLATLRAFLDSLGDAGAAAARLQIHVNTLRYRMRRVVEISGIDLTDADARFALELQLRML
jgi:DNA-binding PucR family transcriptional regulator